jgi:hypothetical protein
MNHEIMYGQLSTRIDIFDARTGCWVNTVYVHRSEYRTWDA